MKRIRVIFIFSIIMVIIAIVMILKSIVSIEEIFKNLLYGGLVSILTALLLEIYGHKQEEKMLVNTFIWKGVIPYLEDMDELFLYSRDIHFLEFVFNGISIDEENWRVYEEVYHKYKNNKSINGKFENYVTEIKRNGIKYNNHISYISELISKIDNKGLFYNKRDTYEYCEKLYRKIENINYVLCEVCSILQNVEHIEDVTERKCIELGVCRWLSYKYNVDYDCNIEDEDDNIEIEESKRIKARDELKEGLDDLIKVVQKI